MLAVFWVDEQLVVSQEVPGSKELLIFSIYFFLFSMFIRGLCFPSGAHAQTFVMTDVFWSLTLTFIVILFYWITYRLLSCKRNTCVKFTQPIIYRVVGKCKSDSKILFRKLVFFERRKRMNVQCYARCETCYFVVPIWCILHTESKLSLIVLQMDVPRS